MKTSFLITLCTMALATATQAAVVVFMEDFDGAVIGYNVDSTTALVGDDDWVDFNNRITTDFSGNEGYATAVGGTESVLTGKSNSNDPQIRTDFEPGFDKTLVTQVTMRMRVDVDKNNAYDDVLAPGNFDLYWGANRYTNPGAGNIGQTNFSFDDEASPVLTAEANGWYTISWSFAAGTLDSGDTDIVRSLRIDPTNLAGLNGSSFEVDYLQVVAVPEPGTAAILGVACATLLALRRRHAA